MARLFGTDGVRGVANTVLSAQLAFDLGRAGAYVLTNHIHRPRILVGRDTRVSGNMLEAALIAGIMSVGADAVTVGVIPTPAVAFLTRYYSCDAGVMISASHNPVEDNGIKFFNALGYKLADEVEDRIESVIAGKEETPRPVGLDIGRRVTVKNPAQDYIDFLLSTVDVRLDGMKIVLDCANGAASDIAPVLFEALGAEVLPYYNTPDGCNINKNCGSTHPERICELVVEQDADCGLAFDGDADRLIACDERGKELDGDHVLAICARRMLLEGRLKGNTAVCTVMSNMGLTKSAEENGFRLERTAVGDRYVLEKMLKDGYCLGGEKSGHVIFLDYNSTGDGMLTALQLLAAVKKDGGKVSGSARVMQNMPQVLLNMTVDNAVKHGFASCRPVAEAIEAAEAELGQNGRILVRPSGTEPLIRIMLEGSDEAQIARLGLAVADAMTEHLGAQRKL
ncbi:MAG: phosphoglucosamine mutase [Firmicutes bacterium]|nr:phosphoglucosamine mutase [Bacillota bacterium]